jgi:hypothetical protein
VIQSQIRPLGFANGRMDEQVERYRETNACHMERGILRDHHMYALSPWKSSAAFRGNFRSAKTQEPEKNHGSFGVVGGPQQS